MIECACSTYLRVPHNYTFALNKVLTLASCLQTFLYISETLSIVVDTLLLHEELFLAFKYCNSVDNGWRIFSATIFLNRWQHSPMLNISSAFNKGKICSRITSSGRISIFDNFSQYFITPVHKTIAMCYSSNIQLNTITIFWLPSFNVYFKIRFVLTKTTHYIYFKLIIFFH